MKYKMELPENSAELMRRAPRPSDVIVEPTNIFDFTGFLEVLLIEHGRDLGLNEDQLLDYRNTIMPAIQVPGQILNAPVARRLVEDLRGRVR